VTVASEILPLGVCARTQIGDPSSNAIVIMHSRQSASAALQFHIAMQQIN
jgi:hypothetical protein